MNNANPNNGDCNGPTQQHLAPMSLLDLPNELLHSVVESLVDGPKYDRWDDDRLIEIDTPFSKCPARELIWLCLTCRRMLEPGRNALYRHLSLNSVKDQTRFFEGYPSSRQIVRSYAKTLHFSFKTPDEKWVDLINFCPFLTHIDITSISISLEDTRLQWNLIDALSSLDQLESLDIKFAGEVPEIRRAFERIKTIPLKYLGMRDADIGPFGSKIVSPVPSNTIRCLVLDNITLDDPVGFFFHWVDGAKEASRFLHIHNINIGKTYPQTMEILGPYLVHFTFTPFAVPDSDSDNEFQFDWLEPLTNLESIRICQHQPEAKELRFLPQSLRRLSLIEIGFKDIPRDPSIFSALESWLADNLNKNNDDDGQQQKISSFGLRYLEVNIHENWSCRSGFEKSCEPQRPSAIKCDQICREGQITTFPESFTLTMVGTG